MTRERAIAERTGRPHVWWNGKARSWCAVIPGPPPWSLSPEWEMGRDQDFITRYILLNADLDALPYIGSRKTLDR